MATIDNRFPTEGTQIDIEARLGAIETALAGLLADTTGQDIVDGLTALANAVKPDASDIPYDSSLSVKGKIDEVVSSINNNQASITRASGVSSSVPLPNITRRGNMVIVHFAQQFPTGTYYDLYDVTPLPNVTQHAVVNMGSSQDLVIVRTDGRLRMNNSKTFSSNTYIIGQLVYLTDE